MAQKDIEIILTRQLASTLAMPVFIVDPDGRLFFYNEPAERILGTRYQETGEMALEQWANMYAAKDEQGRVLPHDELPIVRAFREHRAAHRGMWIDALDGVRRYIEVTAIPLIGLRDKLIGAVAIFWESPR